MKKNSFKTILVVIVLFVIVVIAYYAGVFSAFGVFPGGGQRGEQGGASIAQLTSLFEQRDAFLDSAAANAQDYGVQHASDFVFFKHPTLGYTVRYPVGYAAELDPDEATSFRASAVSPLSSSGETLDVRISSRDFTQTDFNEVKNSFGSDLVSSHAGVINGKRIFVYTLKIPSDLENETAFVRTAFYPECQQSNGTRYTAMLMAAVPEKLSEDLDLADYFIYSFEC
ncbi:MAG: hypothetical protein V1817_01770 [Candidatus Micrarchaeota archaeon]